jgi:RNA polymerase sigma factor (sigma-70 family)
MNRWSNVGGGDPMPDVDRAATLSGPPGPSSDGEHEPDALLLDRFVRQWDQAAFRDLVQRHGPMVLGVCRRILRDAHAAEDAFQATFLLLARKAGSVRKRESIGPWLYGVARRVALEARGAAPRRAVLVGPDREAPGVDDHDGLEHAELHACLHEELGRLPEKYRAPLVLCYIEGHTHESVAGRLGWPIGTVRVRIARGRDLLRERLVRRGLTPAVALLALGLLPRTAAAVPLRLAEATVRAAARVVAGEGTPLGEVPTRVTQLEKKVRNAMHLTGLKWAAVFTLAVLATGAAAAVVPGALAAADDKAKAEAELKKLQGTWVIATFERDGVKQEAQGNEEHFEIEGDSISTWHNGHVEEKGKIKLDPSRNPMKFDVEFQEGKHKGTTNLAIYAWDGAALKLCWVRDGDKHPTDFGTKPGDNRALLILNRQAQ